MKSKVHHFLNKNKVFVTTIYVLIIINVVLLILESYKPIEKEYHVLFNRFEWFSVIVFTLEYIARLWSADHKFKKGRLRFAFSYYGIIDVMAVLPFYLPMIMPFDLRVIRMLRLFMLLRMFKMGGFLKSLRLIKRVIWSSRSELMLTFIVAVMLLLISSTLMYYVERDHQPEKFASIMHAFWWAIATLTTVGYGDVYPITSVGKFLSGAIALIGVGFIALPTGIMSSAFIDELQKKAAKEHKHSTCPSCGHEYKELTQKPT